MANTFWVSCHNFTLIILQNKHLGRVISELGAWVCACAARSPGALMEVANSLVKIARACDEAARTLPSAAKLDADLLGWPGLISKRQPLNTSVIRK